MLLRKAKSRFHNSSCVYFAMLLTRDTLLKMVMFYYILYFVERSRDFNFLICILAETIVVDLYRVDKCLVDITA
jgi:hypothetical protein